MKKRLITAAIAVAALGFGTAAGFMTTEVTASDHDDGETDVKARSLNLTDLFVFREDWQTGNAGDSGNMILIMNTNPRSVAQQQYYFSSTARYEFHVSRGAGTDPAAENDTPADDVILRFEFGAPNASNVQTFTMTLIADGTTSTATGTTTPIGTADNNNALTINGASATVFAGLKEDPFFFDVEQFFRVRAGDAPAFRTPATAVDFAAGYNVNSIVVRIPTTALQGSSSATVFDTWATISIPNGTASVN